MSTWSWQQCLLALCFIVATLCAIVPAITRPRRNRRTNLPPPRPDERSSIEQFRRIIQ